MNQSSIALALTPVELPNIFFQLTSAPGGSDNDAAIDMERLLVRLVRLEPMEDVPDDIIEEIRVRHVEVKMRSPQRKGRQLRKRSGGRMRECGNIDSP